jgi:hypothetical protein
MQTAYARQPVRLPGGSAGTFHLGGEDGSGGGVTFVAKGRTVA